jgi:hypothetical protein
MVTDELFKILNKKIKSYPDQIVPIPNDRIEGTAFFPGGDGLYEHKGFEKTEIMILGQDFDNEENFAKSVERKSEEGNRTWNNLIRILTTHDVVSMEKYFFTNAIMGLRLGTTKNTGRSKAFSKKNAFFLSQCQEFFIEQLKTQKPKLIIGLGAHIPLFLSKTSIRLGHLSRITSLSQIGDTLEKNLFKEVIFNGITDYKTNVIFITHPSLYHSNVVRRHTEGKKFESDLIKLAHKHSFNM